MGVGGSQVLYAQGPGGGSEVIMENISPKQYASTTLPHGVFNLTDVEKAAKSGVSFPLPYFNNPKGSGVTAYIKPEETSEAIPVKPGQMYIYPIDGVAVKSFGVYKLPDEGRAYLNSNGELKIIYLKLHIILNLERGHKNINWLNRLHQNNIFGWDALFNAIR